MTLFLTSSIGGSYKENGARIPCEIDGSNQFVDILKKHWKINSKCLIISSDPDNEEVNDSFKEVFKEAFKLSGLSFTELEICDRRNESGLADILYNYDVVLLAGGHVPTQNRFFKKINLKKLMESYNGIVIGISAGTMNCADVVYAQPELDGEAIDPDYQRYLEGLNLTKLNILPHFQDVKDLTLDGFRVMEDISLPDSKERPFYALVDGAYIYVDNGISTVYGEAYRVADGKVVQICETGKSIQLNKNKYC